jgi:hypothetical protein
LLRGTPRQVVAAEMGAKYISTLPDAGGGQGIFVPGFQSIGEDMLKITSSSSYKCVSRFMYQRAKRC